MRELKNKELIAGLIILILLSITAMVLIVKKEVKKSPDKKAQVIENVTEVSSEDSVQKNTEEKSTVENDTQTSTEASDSISKKNNNKMQNAQTGEKYVPAVMKEYKGETWQLEELYNYWDQYQLNAVEDLIRLERVRTITDELKGTNNFYYYGSTDKNGKPDGKGLAVYANNAYYCGEWKGGLRSGEGMWLQIYPDKAATINGVKGVVEHSYNGMFLNDYPNGTGQEHFDYDMSILDRDDAYNNVIGNFKDGYYDGELYIMTINRRNSTTDWNADAKKGVYLKLEDVSISASGDEAVWENEEEDGLDQEDFLWMHPSKNGNFGIYGLKK